MQKTKRNIFTNPVFVILGAVLCCALWGSATPYIKIGYRLILPIKNIPSTILFAGIRFLIAGLMTVLIYSIARRKLLYPQKQNWGRITLVGAFQTVLQYLFFFVGLSNTSAVKGTILSGCNAFFAILVACFIFKQEKFTVKKIVACLIGLAGIIVVNLNGLDLDMNFMGDGFVLFSAVAAGVASSLVKRYSKYEDAVVISGYQFIIGGLFMIIVGVLFKGEVQVYGAEAWGVLLYLSALSAVAFALWGVLLKYNPVSKVTIYSFTIPVFGVLLSMLLLDPSETTSVPLLNLIITLILIPSGIFMLNYTRNKL